MKSNIVYEYYGFIFLLFIHCKGFLAYAQRQDENPTAKINVNAGHDVWIKIECRTAMNYTEFQKLLFNRQHHAIKNETRTLKIINCPLPDKGNTLTNMLRKLGIVSYHQLLLKSNHTNLNLTKQHISNIRDLQILSLQLKYWENIPEDLFEDISLKSLQTLNLYTNASFIPEKLFNNLENLTTINIGSNVENLDHEVFHKQTKLKYLSLAGNKLKQIHHNIFKNNALLEKLNLENNLLQTLPQDIFVSLPLLTTLDINGNKFRYLPAKLLENNDKIRKFTLTNNYFTKLKLADFFLFDVEKLESVEINCVLDSLEEHFLFNSTSMKVIVLNYNLLEFLPSNLIRHQTELETLDLSHNRLKILPIGFFDHSKAIRRIKLSHNYLTTIERHAFLNLHHLELLDLSHNSLNSNDFTPELNTNYKLNILNLKNNSITDLYIFHNHLPQHLKILDLSFNQIQSVIGKNCELLYVDYLTINLTHNKLHTIQIEDLGTYQKLDSTITVIVDLNENPLKCDCDLWGMIGYSKSINTRLKFLSNNLKCAEPKRLKGTFFQHLKESELICPVQLKYKDFQQCPMHCECWFRPYDRTLIIDCAGKNLTQLPNITNIRNYDFEDVKFNLSMNFINHLPTWQTDDAYVYKTELILYGNQLTSINRNQIPFNVTLLDVRDNQLKLLDEDTLYFLNSSQWLRQIQLTGNNWLCDCSQTSWALYNFTQNNIEKFKDAWHMTCFNPDSSLKYVHDMPNFCSTNDFLFVIISLCMAIIFLMLTLYFKYQTAIEIWLYSNKACLCLITRQDEDSEDLNYEMKYDAFVSYSHKDEEFITNYLVPELENVDPKFRLCIHTRDFLVGDYIPDQIVRCIAESRRVIVVLSKNFLQSEWSKLEFREACRATLEQRRTKIIAIMYEDLGDISDYDQDLEMYLKMNTYLKWGDPRFWQKLRFAMPHIHN